MHSIVTGDQCAVTENKIPLSNKRGLERCQQQILPKASQIRSVLTARAMAFATAPTPIIASALDLHARDTALPAPRFRESSSLRLRRRSRRESRHFPRPARSLPPF